MTALQEAAWSTAAPGADGKEDEWQEHLNPLFSKRKEKERERRVAASAFCVFPASLHARSLPHPKPGKGPEQMGTLTPSCRIRAASVSLGAAVSTHANCFQNNLSSIPFTQVVWKAILGKEMRQNGSLIVLLYLYV